MKSTDTWHVIQDIKRREKDELVRAIKAHGGSYSWYDDEKDEWLDDEERGPMVVAYTSYSTTGKPTDVVIRSVWLDKNGMLMIDAEESEYGNVVDVEWSDIFVGRIPYITEAIPEVGNDEVWQHTLQLWTYDDIETLQELTNQLMEPFFEQFGGKIDHIEFMAIIREEWLPEFNKKYRSQLDESTDYTSDWLKATTEFCELKFNQYIKENSK